MRAASICCIAAGLAAVCARAQEWEVGGAGGFGTYKNATVTNPTGSATAGFDNRFAVGGVVGQDLYEHLSGEIRYTYRDNDLLLSRGAQKVNMDGDTHSVHYDLLFHPTRKGSRVRPFAALGGGARVFRGTGKEYVDQPLGGLALLTKTSDLKALISIGGGVKVSISNHAIIRVDFRDYLSPFPMKLFVTSPGSRIHGWLQDFVPLAGVSFVF